MTPLVILGTVTTLVGLAGLVVCIRRAAAVRRSTDDAESRRKTLSGLVTLNLGSVAVAFFGLAILAVGLIL